MRRGSIPTKLMVPALLAVTACGGGDTGTSSSTEASTDAQTTADPTTGTTADTPATGTTDTTSAPTTTTTTTPTTTDTTTGTDTGSDTTDATSGTDTDATTGGQLPDCMQYKDVDACQVVGCVWESEGMVCIVDCTLLTDEATCDMDDNCMWFDGTCYPPI